MHGAFAQQNNFGQMSIKWFLASSLTFSQAFLDFYSPWQKPFSYVYSPRSWCREIIFKITLDSTGYIRNPAASSQKKTSFTIHQT